MPFSGLILLENERRPKEIQTQKLQLYMVKTYGASTWMRTFWTLGDSATPMNHGNDQNGKTFIKVN